MAGEVMPDAAEDTGRQTADDRPQTADDGRRMFDEFAVNGHGAEEISGSPVTCNLQSCKAAKLQPSPIPQSALEPLFPTETEIYILPDGQVLFADLPAELADLAARLGSVLPCAVERERDRGLGIGDRVEPLQSPNRSISVYERLEIGE